MDGEQIENRLSLNYPPRYKVRRSPLKKTIASSPDTVKLRPGRPSQKSGMNGREQLLQKTRAALKAKPKVDLTRLEIAESAGVTPALVSYYFPDKWDLIEESAAMLVDDYLQDVLQLVSCHAPSLAEFRQLLAIYVKFSMEAGHTLEFFMENIGLWKNLDRLARTREVYAGVILFLAQLMRTGHLRQADPVLLNSVLWSSCHYVVLQYAARPSMFADGHVSDHDTITDTLARLFLGGIEAIHDAADTDSSAAA